MVSGTPAKGLVPPSALGPASALGLELDVPTLSQEMHRGHYPRWDAGGEAWCSPTCVAMVLAFWGTGPTPTDTAWVDPSEDAVVDHAFHGEGRDRRAGGAVGRHLGGVGDHVPADDPEVRDVVAGQRRHGGRGARRRQCRHR